MLDQVRKNRLRRIIGRRNAACLPSLLVPFVCFWFAVKHSDNPDYRVTGNHSELFARQFSPPRIASPNRIEPNETKLNHRWLPRKRRSMRHEHAYEIARRRPVSHISPVSPLGSLQRTRQVGL